MRELATWRGAATSAQKCEAARRILDALLDTGLTPAETREAQEALLALADDPSPKVRAVLAERLAHEPGAPRRLARVLAEDIDTVATSIVAHSLALTEDDLIDLAATGTPRVQCAIARRPRVPLRVAAALAEVGGRTPCLELLANDAATIAPASLRRIVENHGSDGAMRERLLQRRDLPAELRQTLLLQTASALGTADLVRNALGEARAQRVLAEACAEGIGQIADDLDTPGMARFVDHLRTTGQISTAFLLRTACEGRIDLFAASLAALARLTFRRVRALLVDAKAHAFKALCASAGVAQPVVPLLLSAIQAWKAVLLGRVDRSAEEGFDYVMARVMESLPADPRDEPLEEIRALLARLSARGALRSLTPRPALAA
ncbi:DUF2336 domain-containing protein [Aureimonas populi]|uniref:DUF2336 domain-containing protein n=2 Tax=Aureimonas populi TaxID=1701758 RepID=A0ABW5CQY0_9HYPH|nr:DUF2336 domain-containing protein [Aureimonas populi]